MEHPLLMCVVDCFGHFLQTLSRPPWRQRILSEGLRESSAGHIFHCQEWLTRYFTRLVQNYDVRMVQSRYRFSLTQETMALILSRMTASANHFQRH
jgi:hypothetical protein